MTDAMMSLRALAEKSADADVLREMIGFAAQRLMELEVAGLTGALTARRTRTDWPSATAIATGTGRRGLARSSCASPSCGRGATSRASWNRAG